MDNEMKSYQINQGCSIWENEEFDKLSIMYDGDKHRDASSKIRGFLFQDYVTINCIIQDQVKYVCSEYIEDVDIFFEDGTFEYIQVKYYPKTGPNMKEISTDLYYQYLRLELLQSNLKVKPSLYIHGKTNIECPNLEDMKKYIGIDKLKDELLDILDAKEAGKWLKESVQKKNKKAEQKTALFKEMASIKSLNKFIGKYEIKKQLDIIEYKNDLMDKLASIYLSSYDAKEQEHWKLIILGLAVVYVQRRYTLSDTDFKQLRIEKKKFNEFITDSIKAKTDQIIVNYLVGAACEEYGEIINNNELSSLQNHILNLIYRNTLQWIDKIGVNVNWQYKLINTFSTYESSKVESYISASIDDRLLYMAECKATFIIFLDYFWKIIMNICQNKVKNEMEITNHQELFKIDTYVDDSVKDYICLNFPDDKYINHSIILPPANAKFKTVKRKIVDRMLKINIKPRKWFFENNKVMIGKNYYNYSTADVNENPTVADLDEDSFYIECMDCIGIDDEWNRHENCDDCIFSKKCVKEGK